MKKMIVMFLLSVALMFCASCTTMNSGHSTRERRTKAMEDRNTISGVNTFLRMDQMGVFDSLAD